VVIPENQQVEKQGSSTFLEMKSLAKTIKAESVVLDRTTIRPSILSSRKLIIKADDASALL